ncbi:hypothetical protein Vadar_008842 [Vaccinium darrowii]|uniref:Uncharacterized protein n=1 Tax=Vaccinium darrowii TaxID=229202 RepID=A0ACB7WZD2_9ERIC|nr:hypothetical protein Vadar_008842 [Vaccinium darrowii]
MDAAEVKDIVIVGGGICGLATALALHRKGLESIVLERSETLRDTGAAIAIQSNGWRALDQLGLGSKLRQTTIPIIGYRDVWLDKGSIKETPLVGTGTGEAPRCLKRRDLIQTLADALPLGTIHFGLQLASVKLDPANYYPILQLHDGSSIVAKILIGCDGVNSVVANFLGLKPTKESDICSVRGLTNYPNGHVFPHEGVRTWRNDILIGRTPIDNRAEVFQRPELIRESTLRTIDGFPTEFAQLIEGSDLESLSFAHFRYRAPWDLLLGKFRKGTVVVAGDAMHVMGPYLGQGGSAALEDAIVLARCLSRKFVTTVNHLHTSESKMATRMMMHEVGEAMDQYVNERRMRWVQLSTQTYLNGLLSRPSSALMKSACIVFMKVFFSNPSSHTQYDCGLL